MNDQWIKQKPGDTFKKWSHIVKCYNNQRFILGTVIQWKIYVIKNVGI